MNLDEIIVKDLLAQNDLKGISAAFKEMETADISEVYEDLDIRHCIVLFRLIPKEKAPKYSLIFTSSFKKSFLHTFQML